MEINFYHSMERNLVPSVVRLLEKIYISRKRCVLFSPLEERLKIIDKTLWTFSTSAFIPHGDKSLFFCEQQPIYLTDALENPNNAEILVVIDAFDYENYIQNFKKIILMFEDISQLENVNKMYSDLKKKRENVNYWKQSAKGWGKII